MSIFSKLNPINLLQKLGFRGELSDFWFRRAAQPVVAGINVNEDTAFNYSAVWAATRLLCGTGACLPLNLYKKRSTRGQDIQTDDPRQRLIHSKPNPEMTSMGFRLMQFNNQINWGNAYSEIERITGNNFYLWPIHPSRVTVVRDEKTNLIVYKVKNDRDEKDTLIPAKDMLHVPSLITKNGITGLGVIENARESIGFGIATERYGADWFGGGGIPRIFVQHEKQLTQEARDQFRDEWREIYGGADKGKVGLLTEGATVHPIGFSQEDSQFLETREHNINEIARWYGVPPHMIADLRRATFSNIEQMGIEFVQYSLIPWLKLWEQEYWTKLLSREEQKSYYFEHIVTALLRGDLQSRASWYSTLVNLGVLSPNDVREFENLNPYEDGDVYMVQGAMEPIDKIGEDPEPVVMPAPAIDPKEPEKEVPTGNNGKEKKPENKNGSTKKNDAVDDTQKLTDNNQREEWVLGINSAISDTVDKLLLENERLSAEVDGKIRTSIIDQNGRVQLVDEKNKLLAERRQIIDSAYSMLEASIKRMLHKHCLAAKRASKDPHNFLNWNDSFSEKNKEVFLSEISTHTKSFSLLNIPFDPEKIVDSHLETAHSALLKASEVQFDEFEDSIESCVSEWESSRVSILMDSVLNEELLPQE